MGFAPQEPINWLEEFKKTLLRNNQATSDLVKPLSAPIDLAQARLSATPEVAAVGELPVRPSPVSTELNLPAVTPDRTGLDLAQARLQAPAAIAAPMPMTADQQTDVGGVAPAGSRYTPRPEYQQQHQPGQPIGLWERIMHALKGAGVGALEGMQHGGLFGAIGGAAAGGIGAGYNPENLHHLKYNTQTLPMWRQRVGDEIEVGKAEQGAGKSQQEMAESQARIQNYQTDNGLAQRRAQDAEFEKWDVGDPVTGRVLTLEEARRIGRPDLTGQRPSGGKRTGKVNPAISTDEGYFERTPDGQVKPLMSPDTRRQPVQSAPFSGITTGQPSHQLMPYEKSSLSPGALTENQKRSLDLREREFKYKQTQDAEKAQGGGFTPVQLKQLASQFEHKKTEAHAFYNTKVAPEEGMLGNLQNWLAKGETIPGSKTTTNPTGIKVTPEMVSDQEEKVAQLRHTSDTMLNEARALGEQHPHWTENSAGGDIDYKAMKSASARRGGGGQRRSIDELKAQARADVKAAGESPAAIKAFEDTFQEKYR